ncbi:MAG: ADOP family duplicated permease [Gemmatimonadaceae bacterium]
MTLREMLARVVAWTQRGRLERELDSEMRAHLELLARDLEHEGMPRAEALLAARKQLGNATAQREASRDYWGFPTLDALLRDARYALRGLARTPGFSITVVATFALGIGANAAMFGVIDRLMFRPFPYLRDPGTVHQVYYQTTFDGVRGTRTTTPYTRHLDMMRGSRSFSAFASVSEWRFAVGRAADTRVRKVAGVSASLFGFFDATPVRGRFFTGAEDTVPVGAFVAVLGHDFWRSEFGGRDVLGERLRVGQVDYTIIGVAPKGFTGVATGGAPQLFVPITTIPANFDTYAQNNYYRDYRWDWTELFARRKPDVSVAAATEDLTQAFRRARAIQRESNPRVAPDSVALPAALAGPARDAAGPDPGPETRVLLWVVGVAAIVLLIACANVANLMLARAQRRRREIAVRLALGVSRGRLVFQFVTEGLLLALLGGAAGLVVAQWMGAGIRAMLLPEGSSFSLGTDWRTIGVAAACVMGAALLTALAPAFVSIRSSLSATLKAGVREGTYRTSRARSTLLVVQAALSVALLVGAGLFVQSVRNVGEIPLGFDVRPVLEITPDFRGFDSDSAGAVGIRRRLLATAQAIPGVEAAARINSGLFRTNTTGLRVPGIDSVERLGRFNMQISTPDYFKVMRTRILRGRAFDASDGERAPGVVVVSASMARALWPDKEAIGECIQLVWDPLAKLTMPACTRVIGVAEDVASQGIMDEKRFMYYLPVDQVNPGWIARIYVRMAGPYANADIERVRQAMQAAMPGDGFVIVRPLQEVVDDQQRSWRLGATLFLAFGALALLVAAVGLYGVIAYDVAQRTHELGVRAALGAKAGDIVSLVMRQGLGFAGVGALAGLAIAAIAAPRLQPLLYKESARDPLTYVAVAAVMILVAAAASSVPAFRASRADPCTALRSD